MAGGELEEQRRRVDAELAEDLLVMVVSSVRWRLVPVGR
jgi:hypothetical protein